MVLVRFNNSSNRIKPRKCQDLRQHSSLPHFPKSFVATHHGSGLQGFRLTTSYSHY